MVNHRLMWWLENNNFISSTQYGFRKNRSTIDNLLDFESEIQEAFKKKEHLLAVLFDLKKAYDSTWRYHILMSIAALGINGHMYSFIKNFIIKRTFWVLVEDISSDLNI